MYIPKSNAAWKVRLNAGTKWDYSHFRQQYWFRKLHQI